MQFSIENIKTLVSMAYVHHAADAFGAQGEQALTALLDSLRLLYQRCPPECLRGTLTVVRSMSGTPGNPRLATFGAPIAKTTYQDVAQFLLDSIQGSHCFVEVAANGQFFVITLAQDVDLKLIAADSVVYRFNAGVESILAGQHEDYVLKISPLLFSNFAVPTLNGLDEAMTFYRGFAAESKCRILANVWEGGVDGPRLVLVNRPESYMRDSLVQALQLVLRDTSVRPEQNTDETKPVDIRVEWFASGASALIEVKWLGRSTAAPQKNATKGQATVTSKKKKTYTNYFAGRAQEGADQLADYMDREVRHSSANTPRGYLVVFDARRKNIRGASDRLSAVDAMNFAFEDIAYNPDHSKLRDDFALPVRYFLKPRQSFFTTS
jgi:hypothetical protein